LIRLLHGDCRDVLRNLPDNSVHCVVTSPPYWGLRDYGVGGQIGLEATPAEYVEAMVGVFREVRRVLKDDGTAWVNLGDSYHNGAKGGYAKDRITATDSLQRSNLANNFIGAPNRQPQAGLKPKDLVGMPWRVAFALQADGWYLRQDIIWSKPNPMPESVQDRCTKAHEYIFLLSKSERYFYDAEAIREPNDAVHMRWLKVKRKTVGGEGVPGVYQGAFNRSIADGNLEAIGRNKRSVWEVATAPFSEAHFATFPPALIEPCILAGCPGQCCAKCGSPLVRQVERSGGTIGHGWIDGSCNRLVRGMSQTANPGGGIGKAKDCNGKYYQVKMLGWASSCKCNVESIPGTVLDPFGGAGTTGLVADRLGRNAILIELNADYADMAKRRIADDAGMFAQVI